ncbi:MAG: N-carbamoylputrescine amidase [Acidocella sp. 20-57-95]|nr:MAG: N-carbamoylputrescine amidase [Acidocella sp. 20-57-95]OYV57857.1 MAG: N-carbamoylputrescine amidase [Acidocella sp. 21-58-7]HQT64906.1 N-carbamoylputrescine amidase [Acidocella sp.]HQU03838.1 N-carbamoylputrescine amidase [Acidocella sp.]
MRNVTVAATQMACGPDAAANIARAEALVRKAAAKGAQIILIQELFETRYFCQDQMYEFLALAKPLATNMAIAHFTLLAKELGVVLPISVYEKSGQSFFNTVVILDADGSNLGYYRKSHIPDGPGYSEKFYFSPGDTGFKVWDTKYARIGVGICWDQWFPETARAMALIGAELLLFPTAIGSEPQDARLDSCGHWQRTMQGHAAANLTPLVASNRIGTEPGMRNTAITFYGSSFIADQTGNKVAEAGRDEETVLTATFDLDAIAHMRASWGVFRDRRPELYGPLMTLDGQHKFVSGR